MTILTLSHPPQATAQAATADFSLQQAEAIINLRWCMCVDKFHAMIDAGLLTAEDAEES